MDERPYEAPPVPSAGVSAVPTPGAVSDLKPEQPETVDDSETSNVDESEDIQENAPAVDGNVEDTDVA